MSTLLLRLAAPLQSWGASSRFKKLSTEREPTKSGVVGLIAAALGRDRHEDISDLNTLRFGVRADQPGTLLRDYHTARNPKNDKLAFISERYYLCDAVFVVGLESEDEFFLERIKLALQNPRFPLFLGRRSCPLSGETVLCISPLQLEEALRKLEWKASSWYMKKKRGTEDVPLEIILDTSFEASGAFYKRDIPYSFNTEHRRYGFRCISSDIQGVTVKNPLWISSAKDKSTPVSTSYQTKHDPFLILEVSDVSFKS